MDPYGLAPEGVGLTAPVVGATGGTLVGIAIATGNPFEGSVGVRLVAIAGGLEIWDLTSAVEQIEAVKNGKSLNQIKENNQKIQDLINKGQKNRARCD